MAVSVVDVNTAQIGGVGPLIIPAPSGIVPGMVLVAVVNSSTSIASPVGWVSVVVVTYESRVLEIRYKIATASEPAGYQFIDPGAHSGAGGVFLLAGVDVSTPVDVFSSARNVAPTDPVTSAATLPSMVTTQGGDFLITGVGGTSTVVTWGTPGGMFEEYQLDSSNAVIQHASHSETLGAAGATGTRVFSAGVNTRWGVVGAAFMPKQGRWWTGVAGWGQG